MSIHRQSSLMDRTIYRMGSFFVSFREQPNTPSSSYGEQAVNEKAVATRTSYREQSSSPSHRGGPEANETSGEGGDSSTENEFDAVAFLVEMTLRIGVAVISGYLLSWWTRRWFARMLPDSEEEKPASQVYSRLQRILQKRGWDGSLPQLSSHERQMAEDILDPDDIDSSFADIGGLDATKQEIYELAVLPLVQPELFSDSKLIQPVKGILLYGKPGTGKTMLAKALAKESQAVFLPLQLSKILHKYWGESNKLVAATFSLAHKLQPAIIFIDELDTFLKNTNSETAYMDSIKAEFLTLWDGVSTASQSRVLVLGATNKPQGIDSAILRRMPRAFEVPLPDEEGRLAILKLLFKGERADESVTNFLPQLAQMTVGYSGSDLKELCKAAAMVPVQERTAEFARRRVMGEADPASTTATRPAMSKIRPISAQDLRIGLQKVQRTGAAAHQYGQSSQQEQRQRDGARIDMNSLQHLAAMLRTLSSLSVDEEKGDDIPNVR